MTQQSKPKILIICEFYLPGYKSGGGMRTLANTVERLGDEFDFWIITRDHDGKADRTPYTTVKINEWNKLGKARVFYLSKDKVKLSVVRKLVKEVEPKSIYLNSYFSSLTVFVLLLRKFENLKKYPLIIAPEGELSKGALQLKSKKKKLYLGFSSALNLYRDIIWKTTSEFEAKESENLKGTGGKIFIAPNMPPYEILPDYKQSEKPAKLENSIKLVFLSRVHPKKNLKYILEILKKIEDRVVLDIYGPHDDEEYIDSCRKVINSLSKNIKVNFKGEIEYHNVAQTLFDYHFFVLPTLGENFGHVFIEALAAGCPLLCSDRTPWINLEEKGIGWDLPLEKTEKWVEVLSKCIKMDALSYSKLSVNARNYAVRWLADAEVENATRKVLEYSLSKT